MPPPRLLALDFDGVVSDSAPEAYVVARRAHAVLRGGGSGDVGGPLDPSPARVEVTATAAYGAFVAMMPLGNRAEDYAVVLEAVDAGVEIPDQAAYDARRRALPEDFARAFHRRFYEVRHALADRDPEGWYALMAPYAPLLGVLRRRAGDARLAIATAKDRRSVRALLCRYGIDDLFDDAHLLDKEAGVSKRRHLEALHERTGTPFADITFVDDKHNHLEDVAPLGVRCALAAWGYNGAREALAATRRGHLVCTLEDFEAQVFGSARGLGLAVEPA